MLDILNVIIHTYMLVSYTNTRIHAYTNMSSSPMVSRSVPWFDEVLSMPPPNVSMFQNAATAMVTESH